MITEQNMSKFEVARLYNTDVSVIKRWVSYYEEFNIAGLINRQRSYDGKFKLKVVEYMHDNHLSIRSTAKHFNIPQHYTVSRWERIYYEEGPAALFEERRGRGSSMTKKKSNNKNTLNKETKENLIAEVQRLRMENDYLKKLNALVQERISRENGKKPPSSKN